MSLLELKGLTASYPGAQVLHGIDCAVEEGQIALLLGANGAGKTTTLRAISGTVSRRGSIHFAGTDINGLAAERIVGLGIAHVPQGRGTFNDLTVVENLQIGAYRRRDAEVASDIDRWLHAFPVLGDRRNQRAGLLSGGEQQMLAIARAMMLRPRLLMLDEPSLGLAPKIVQSVFEILQEINRTDGTAMLIVEQNADLALRFADYGYVLEAGHQVLSGTAEELAGSPAVRDAYLGIGGAQ